MIVADIKGEIVDTKTALKLRSEEEPCNVFCVDDIKPLIDNSTDSELFININTNGGYIDESKRGYDILRTCGKNIHTNIEGACHSAGIIFLLSAPKENRTADPNSKSLIHLPRLSVVEFTSDEVRQQADLLDKQTNDILDIYQERTGTDKEVLFELMKQEKTLNADQLLQYGFISKINSYNTNLKPNQMAEMTNEVKGFLGKAKELLLKITNLENSDEPKPDEPKPDDKVDAVVEPTEAEILKAENEALKAQVAETETKVTDLTTKVTEMTNLIEESKAVITNLERSVVSTFKVPAKVAQPKATNKGGEMSAEELKNEMKEKRKNFKQ